MKRQRKNPGSLRDMTSKYNTYMSIELDALNIPHGSITEKLCEFVHFTGTNNTNFIPVNYISEKLDPLLPKLKSM